MLVYLSLRDARSWGKAVGFPAANNRDATNKDGSLDTKNVHKKWINKICQGLVSLAVGKFRSSEIRKATLVHARMTIDEVAWSDVIRPVGGIVQSQNGNKYLHRTYIGIRNESIQLVGSQEGIKSKYRMSIFLCFLR